MNITKYDRKRALLCRPKCIEVLGTRVGRTNDSALLVSNEIEGSCKAYQYKYEIISLYANRSVSFISIITFFSVILSIMVALKRIASTSLYY